jgi:hypothetical protein
MASRAALALLMLAIGCNANHSDSSVDLAPLADLAPPPSKTGSVNVFASRSTNGQTQVLGEINVLFEINDDPACVTTTLGACMVANCPMSPQPVPAVAPNAGSVSVAITGLHPFVLTPKADGTYDLIADNLVNYFSGGESIAVHAAGADVPAFDGTLAHAPDQVTFTTPRASLEAIGRRSDLTITWTAGQWGDVLVRIATMSPLSVTCSAPTTAGALTVPSSALAQLAPGAIDFQLDSEAAEDFAAGDWQIDLRGEFLGVFSDGTESDGIIMLQ